MKNIIILFTLVLLPVFSIASPSISKETYEMGEYIFDCTYPNSAWSVMNGFYIDDKGNIIKYEVIKPWRGWVDISRYSKSKATSKKSSKTHDENSGVSLLPDAWSPEEENRLQDTVLSDKFQNKEIVGSLPKGELEQRVALIPSVAKGKVTPTENTPQVCEAYSYDKTTKKYTVINIGSFRSADGGVKNSAEEAKILLEWLQSVEKEYVNHNRPLKRSQ